MKNLLLAILLAIALVCGLSAMSGHFMNMHIVLDDMTLSPAENLLGIGIVGIVFTLLGFAVAVSVFGLLAFVVLTVVVALVVAGISAFWPFILGAAVVIWLFRDKPSTAH